MKANEIQIGDWLYYKGQFNAFPFKVESITKKKVGYHAEPNEHRMYYLRLSECKPIPLNPEIPEKNGFRIIFEGELHTTYFQDIEGFHVEIKIDCINYIKLSMLNGLGYNITIECKFVHQLQNALRLCGINHEIIL